MFLIDRATIQGTMEIEWVTKTSSKEPRWCYDFVILLRSYSVVCSVLQNSCPQRLTETDWVG